MFYTPTNLLQCLKHLIQTTTILDLSVKHTFFGILWYKQSFISIDSHELNDSNTHHHTNLASYVDTSTLFW